MFDWSWLGIGVLVGLTLFFGWGAVALGTDRFGRGDAGMWILAALFLIGCSLIGGLIGGLL